MRIVIAMNLSGDNANRAQCERHEALCADAATDEEDDHQKKKRRTGLSARWRYRVRRKNSYDYSIRELIAA